jgi:hypothetical protein
MRIINAAAILFLLGGCAVQPPAPYAQVALPYSACGAMAGLRSNLTASLTPSARSDAQLHRLGVRCIGDSAGAYVSGR